MFGIVGALGDLSLMLKTSPQAMEVLARNPIPVRIQLVMSVAGTAVMLVSGYFILAAKNWARYLYVIWSGIGLVIAAITSPMRIMLIPGVAVYLAIAVFLFRPQANAFFSNAGREIDPQSVPSARQIAGVLSYILAGIFFAGTVSGALFTGDMGVAKILMMSFFVLPFAILLSVGRWLLQSPRWKRDVGIVLLASSAAGAVFATVMVAGSKNPDFWNAGSQHDVDFSLDYRFAVGWLCVWAILGAALLVMSRKESKSA
jgi:hypothetical protein